MSARLGLGLVLMLGLATSIAACAERAPEPETTVELVAITTARQPADFCMEALISGVLVEHPVWGLALGEPGGDQSRPIFPFRYSAVRVNGTVVLLDAEGKVVARVGDRIESSGGSIGFEGEPGVLLCAGTIRVVPPG
ncbi:MAG: hypothetical protein L0227_06075 [Chloroflexi bacterium]|nr:hypothetical protein [Chloroflexota bacterium]